VEEAGRRDDSLVEVLSRRPLVRRGLDGLKARVPTAYWRVRNAAALAAWCAGAWHRRLVAPRDAYDDAFWTFHETGDWEGFARAALARVPARSVVDVGCGHGLALQGFARVDPTLRLKGFDASPAALARARARGLDVEELDLVSLPRREVAAMAGRIGEFDLAVCLEVAEHLPPWHARTLVGVLAGARRLIFSAAHPNQGGRLHVNEQPASYWLERFRRSGFRVSPDDDAFRRAVAALALPPWYAENVHLVERTAEAG